MFESVEKLPYGLAALQIDGVQQHIAELSPRRVVVRAMAPVAAGSTLRFSFYRPEDASYEHVQLYEYEVESVQRQNGAVLTRLSFLGNAGIARAVRRALNDYARYVRLRSEYGASAYGSELGLYPLAEDDVFFESFEAQCEAWHASLLQRGPLRPEDRELALCMDAPEMLALYLKTPAEGLMQAYMRARCIPEELLKNCKPRRLYVGNPHCSQLFPDAQILRAVLQKAGEEKLAVTVVTAQLREAGIPAVRTMLSGLAESSQARMEVVFNDWGMLMLMQPHLEALEPVLGTRLNARRKDPRMRYKAGTRRQTELLRENALNSEGYRDYLRKFGVRRYEYEVCGMDFRTAPGQHSIHLPYYQTNTSMYCPLRAYCETGDRGHQASDANCPGYCAKNGFLYPAHLKLTGRFNSLLALDDMEDWRALEPFDRWVLNF